MVVGPVESNRGQRARPRAPELAARDIEQTPRLNRRRAQSIDHYWNIRAGSGRQWRYSSCWRNVTHCLSCHTTLRVLFRRCRQIIKCLTIGSFPGVLLKDARSDVLCRSERRCVDPQPGNARCEARKRRCRSVKIRYTCDCRCAGFRLDLTVDSDYLLPAPVLRFWRAALGDQTRAPRIARKGSRLGAARRFIRRTAKYLAGGGRTGADTGTRSRYAEAPNLYLREIVDAETIVISEYSFRQEYCPLDTPGGYFAVSSAGGLGWGFPASLGAKLASPGKMVLSVLGDGAYMFANPTACHYMAQMQNLPVLTVIYNNSLYGAVRRATLRHAMATLALAAESDGRFSLIFRRQRFAKNRRAVA